MIEKRFWFGMLVMIFAFGMMFVGCDKETPPDWLPYHQEMKGTLLDDGKMTFTYNGSMVTLTKISGAAETLDGIWTGTVDGTSVKVTVSGSNWTTTDTAGNNMAKGTITKSGTTITIIITHIWDDGGSSDNEDSTVEDGYLPPTPHPDDDNN